MTIVIAILSVAVAIMIVTCLILRCHYRRNKLVLMKVHPEEINLSRNSVRPLKEILQNVT
jgi:hypothetical protein